MLQIHFVHIECVPRLLLLRLFLFFFASDVNAPVEAALSEVNLASCLCVCVCRFVGNSWFRHCSS